MNLAIQYENELERARTDRSLSPLYTDVYYLHWKWRLKNHGEANGEGMFSKLKELVPLYNAKYSTE